MKLLCFIDSLGSGGAQRQMLAVAKHMKQNGHEVYVAWYADYNFYRSAFEEIGAECIHRVTNGIWGRIRFFSEAVKEVRPDTVLAFLATPSTISSLYKLVSFSNWRLVISIRGNNKEKFVSTRYKLMHLLYTVTSAIVCNSFSELEVWNKHCGHLSKKVCVIPNYINVPLVGAERKNQNDVGKLRILVAANLCSDIKNPLNVAKAIEKLSPTERERILIDWYGRRYNGQKLSMVCEKAEKYIEDHKLGSFIITHDETHDIYLEMEKSDVVALFSTEEGLPNSICEGMMMGKPVIMTKVSDWKKLIDGNGVVCEGTDDESIAKALRVVIGLTEDKIQNMGIKSFEIANKLFDEETISQKWECTLVK